MTKTGDNEREAKGGFSYKSILNPSRSHFKGLIGLSNVHRCRCY